MVRSSKLLGNGMHVRSLHPGMFSSLVEYHCCANMHSSLIVVTASGGQAAVNGLRLWERDLSHEAAGLVLVSVPCALEPILQAVAESKKTVQRVHLVLFAVAGSEEETQQIESAVLDASPANMDGDANSISVGVQELGELQTTSQSDQTSGLVRELQKQRIYAPQHIWMLAETHQVSADAIAAVSQSMNCWQRTLSATLRLCYTSPNIQQPTITRSNI